MKIILTLFALVIPVAAQAWDNRPLTPSGTYSPVASGANCGWNTEQRNTCSEHPCGAEDSREYILISVTLYVTYIGGMELPTTLASLPGTAPGTVEFITPKFDEENVPPDFIIESAKAVVIWQVKCVPSGASRTYAYERPLKNP